MWVLFSYYFCYLTRDDFALIGLSGNYPLKVTVKNFR